MGEVNKGTQKSNRHYPENVWRKPFLPHKRKPEKIKERSQKYKAKKLVWKQSYKDPILAETICRTEPEQIQTFLSAEYGFCQLSDVPDVTRGLIISDSRGEGVYNK